METTESSARKAYTRHRLYSGVSFFNPFTSSTLMIKKRRENKEPYAQYIMCAIPGIEYDFFQKLVRQ